MWFRFCSVLAENHGFGFGLKTVNSPTHIIACAVYFVKVISQARSSWY